MIIKAICFNQKRARFVCLHPLRKILLILSLQNLWYWCPQNTTSNIQKEKSYTPKILARLLSPSTVEVDKGHLRLSLAISAVPETSKHGNACWNTEFTIARTEFKCLPYKTYLDKLESSFCFSKKTIKSSFFRPITEQQLEIFGKMLASFQISFKIEKKKRHL